MKFELIKIVTTKTAVDEKTGESKNITYVNFYLVNEENEARLPISPRGIGKTEDDRKAQYKEVFRLMSFLADDKTVYPNEAK